MTKSRLLGSLVGREVVDEDRNIMGDLEYRKRKGESSKERKGIAFTLRAQTQISHFGKLLFVPPPLLIGPVIFRLRTKYLA